MTLRILGACWLLAAGAASGAPHSLRECRYLFLDGGECSKDTLHYPTQHETKVVLFAWCSLTTNPPLALRVALCTAVCILRITRWIAHSILVRTVALPGQPIQPTVCVRVGVLVPAHTYVYVNAKCT